ncbi:hypothetical protein ALQ89_200091 [Pseudomonas amygdali pv. tabaci]|uniref:Uncharacterized protein n=1 Tax=Pseudomonas amygdali pv. tabaci TaxID=322 RepID=A0AAX1VZF0_PSEAJ|nr:hypothetical protein ALO60_200077 [Pseudomonas amygdali pv. tabaci]RML83551.1 hypothetical protein ALQ89_200091 [Pseudomonas amygdali pv. tabaci]
MMGSARMNSVLAATAFRAAGRLELTGDGSAPLTVRSYS